MVFSSLETDGGAEKTGTEPGRPHTAEELEPVGRTGTITTVLSRAGNSLEGAQAELVLNPLRLAFETKNLKIIEPALDCLHVCSSSHFCNVIFEILYRLPGRVSTTTT